MIAFERKGFIQPYQITSSCPMVCTQCLYTFQDQEYMYIKGDLIIPAIFDIHYRGTGPFNCGNIRTTDLQHINKSNYENAKIYYPQLS
jgi:N-acetylglucosamine-6-phosphate deacetylase